MKKVKLLDNKGNRGVPKLERHIGEVLEVVGEDPRYYRIAGMGPDAGWLKARFRVVNDDGSRTLDEILGLEG